MKQEIIEEKVLAILQSIDDNYHRIRDGIGDEEHDFDNGYEIVKIAGQLGDNVNFDGVWNKKFCYMEKGALVVKDNPENAEINLYTAGKQLGKITVKYDYRLDKSRPFYRDQYGCKIKDMLAAQFHMTDIDVVSPCWDKTNGVTTAMEYERENYGIYHGKTKLEIYHAKDETVETVIEHMYKVITSSIAKSTAKAKITKKLRELNLPDLKLHEATERLISVLYGENDRTQSPDRDREM